MEPAETVGDTATVATTLGDLDGNGSVTNDVTLADLNGDGEVDIVSGNSGTNRMWLNSGLGGFQPTFLPLGNSQTLSLAVADVDVDGDLDFVSGNANQALIGGAVASEPNLVWIQRDNGSFFADQSDEILVRGRILPRETSVRFPTSELGKKFFDSREPFESRL